MAKPDIDIGAMTRQEKQALLRRLIDSVRAEPLETIYPAEEAAKLREWLEHLEHVANGD